ncbi:MAG: HPF/RaiA family ribosome-associated protein [Gammaproteobacteria bacterium]|nr:HPF/RaiA family ribosome-associated protein [Gammaproteobacteria bacterium]
MNIDIQARDFLLTGPLKREVERRVTGPLSARHDHIKRITVRLGDVNGPRGGEDKYCRIKVELSGQKEVYVEDIEADMYTAIYRAADRANRTVSRRISRQRERPIRHVSRGVDMLSDEQAVS